MERRKREKRRGKRLGKKGIARAVSSTDNSSRSSKEIHTSP
jgi:hypothetical protein